MTSNNECIHLSSKDISEVGSLGHIDIVQYNKNELSIHGWLIDPHIKLEKIFIEIDGSRYETVSHIVREDVAKAYPNIPHALYSGFVGHIHILQPSTAVQISVIGIVDGKKIVELRHKLSSNQIGAQKTSQKKNKWYKPESIRAAIFWDNNVKIHEDITSPISWLDSSLVRTHAIKKLPAGQKNYCVNEWLIWVKDSQIPFPLERGLSIGCGDGSLERHAIKLHICSEIDACDISPVSIEKATQLAEKDHLSDSIHYFVCDMNTYVLESHKYDIIFCGSSLHHIKNLEHAIAQIKDALKPDGLLILNEFVGPSQFQWTDKQLKIMNELLDIIPMRLRVDTTTGNLKTTISRPSLDHMNKNDPSEAIRSQEINHLIEQNFTVIDRIDFGGTLLHMLLHSIVDNFNASNDDDIAILRLLGYIEQILIEESVITSDFAFIIAKKVV